MNNTIVFGGWAVPPDILKGIGGDDALYVDVNRMMTGLFGDDMILKSHWEGMITSLYASTNTGTNGGDGESDNGGGSGKGGDGSGKGGDGSGKGGDGSGKGGDGSGKGGDGSGKGVARNAPTAYDTMIGWSTGAMFAYALARACHPKNLILISATPCFCRREDFRYGTRPTVIDQMIAALSIDKDAVLKSFYERCGLPYDPTNIPDYTVEELTCGLEFLKQADLRPLSPLPTTDIHFHHGSNDIIIPTAASKYFHEQIGGTYNTYNDGHSFFPTSPLP